MTLEQQKDELDKTLSFIVERLRVYKAESKWSDLQHEIAVGSGVVYLAFQLGLFKDDDEMGLWNHRLKFCRMNVSKKELKKWL